jgi:hypothetical protein
MYGSELEIQKIDPVLPRTTVDLALFHILMGHPVSELVFAIELLLQELNYWGRPAPGMFIEIR